MQPVPVDDSLIWEYIDGIISPGDKKLVDTLLEQNKEWREKHAELLQLHQELLAQPLDEPSMRFTKNVMEAISQLHIAPAAKTYLNKNIIRAVGGFFVLTILGMLVTVFANQPAAAPVQSTALDGLADVDFTPMFNNATARIFLMLNVVLGLFLIDRWLAGKRRGWL